MKTERTDIWTARVLYLIDEVCRYINIYHTASYFLSKLLSFILSLFGLLFVGMPYFQRWEQFLWHISTSNQVRNVKELTLIELLLSFHLAITETQQNLLFNMKPDTINIIISDITDLLLQSRSLTLIKLYY